VFLFSDHILNHIGHYYHPWVDRSLRTACYGLNSEFLANGFE